MRFAVEAKGRTMSKHPIQGDAPRRSRRSALLRLLLPSSGKPGLRCQRRRKALSRRWKDDPWIRLCCVPGEVRRYGSQDVFIIDQDKVVYEKNLGKDTVEAAKAMTQFNPDNTWTAL